MATRGLGVEQGEAGVAGQRCAGCRDPGSSVGPRRSEAGEVAEERFLDDVTPLAHRLSLARLAGEVPG